MNPLFRLLGHARPHRARLASAIGAMVLYGAASTGLTLVIQPIFDDVLGGHRRLGVVTSWILALYLLKGIGAYLSAYLMADVGQRVVRDIRNVLFRHILNQSAAFFSTRPVGKLLSRIINDVGQVQQAVSETLGDLARETLVLVGCVGVLLYHDARLALVSLTGAPLVVYPLVRLGQRVRRTTRRSQEALEAITHLGAEAFAGHRIVKAFGAEGRESEKFASASQYLYRTNLKVTSVLAVLPPIMEFVGGLAIVGALWYARQEIGAGRLTTGEFTSFIAALIYMYGPAKKLSRVNANLQQAIAASERMFEILDTHSEVHQRPGATALPPFTESIEFRDIRFAYEDRDGATLRGVSFTVRAGQTLAIVGRSGAGKTTLVNLLPRFYDPAAGQILIDGRDIRDFTLASLRGQIGMVTQDTLLFDDTIAANIAFGRPGASPSEIAAAAEAANAHEFVRGLPDGYDTLIGERGQRLSGGQRQRIAIARAVLRDSPILILDEATAALDNEAEAIVVDALANLMARRTSFVIAHRLSTVRRADAIIVLERGRIVEIGMHDALLAQGGAYARLYDLQLEDVPSEIET